MDAGSAVVGRLGSSGVPITNLDDSQPGGLEDDISMSMDGRLPTWNLRSAAWWPQISPVGWLGGAKLLL